MMRKRPLCMVVLLFLVIQLIRIGGFQNTTDLKSSFLEEHAQNGSWVRVTGTVFRREVRANKTQIYLTDVSVHFNDQIHKEPDLLISIKQPTHQMDSQQSIQTQSNQQNPIRLGNRVFVSGTLRFFESATNPGNFDQKFYYQKQGIHCSVQGDTIQVVDQHYWKLRERLTQSKEGWKELLDTSMGPYYGGCMSAILLGEKSSLEESMKMLYQKSGIGHILAISGLHMSFLGVGCYQLFRKCGAPFWVSCFAGSLFLLLYTIMIGGGVSSQRALIMFLIRMGADLSGRNYDLLTSLSVAACVLIAQQPLYLYDSGFLLSFGAILGVAVVNPWMETLKILPKCLRAAFSIQLVLLPIMLYFYFEIPLYSILLNLVVIPLMSVVLSAGIFGSFLTFLLPVGIGKGLLLICKWILWLYEAMAATTLKFPMGRWILGQPTIGRCILYYGILFGICFYLSYMTNKKEGALTFLRREVKKRRVVLWAGVLLYGVLFCIGTKLGHGLPGTMKVTAVDVGQGDCFYIRTPKGLHILVDGGSTSIQKVGKYRIEPFLKSQGVEKLDYVFLSHGDEDHIGGVKELLDNPSMGVQIQTLVLPTEAVLDEKLLDLARLAQKQGTTVVTIESEEQITDGALTVQCLAPKASYIGEKGNEASMVLELRYRNFGMLFTGDLEGNGEEQLLRSGELRQTPVLKAAHHGSSNSSSEEFLDTVSPKVTLFSAGKDNSYGHPHKEVIQRLEQRQCQMYCTKEMGAIQIWTNGKKMKVTPYLK